MYKSACCRICAYNPESRRSDFVKCHASSCVTIFFCDTKQLLVLIWDYPLELPSDVYIYCSDSIYPIFPQLWLYHLDLNKGLNCKSSCSSLFLLLWNPAFSFLWWNILIEPVWWCVYQLAGSGLYLVQSNLYKTTTLGTTQKWLSWAGGHLIKHLDKTATKHMWSFLAGF